jgi:hypothetical protein
VQNDPSNPILWQPFKVEDTFGPTSLGGNNRIKRVWFHILGADDSYVDIPVANFDAAHVSAAIEQHVAATIDVLQLKGQAF